MSINYSNTPQDFGQPLVLEDFMSVEQPVTANSSPICAFCHKTVDRIKRCGHSKNIGYCSKDCQTSDWKQHKLVCKTVVISKSVNPNNRRAMHFARSQAGPYFIWLTYGNDGMPLNIAQCFSDTPTEQIKTIAFHNHYLPYWIQISYDSNVDQARFFFNTSPILGEFRGPIVVLAYDAVEGLSKPALNVDTTTLGPVVEYAKLRAEYNGPIFVEQPQERYTEEQWNAITARVTPTQN